MLQVVVRKKFIHSCSISKGKWQFEIQCIPENWPEMSWKCPEKYIKAYIFFIIQWIEFKFQNVEYISIYLTNI
jgi:hypothetical protein